MESSAPSDPLVAVARLGAAGAGLVAQSYGRTVDLGGVESEAELVATIPDEAAFVFLIPEGAGPGFTAIEVLLWALDSQPAHVLALGRPWEDSPVAFRAGVFLKQPERFGGSMLVRREFFDPANAPGESVAPWPMSLWQRAARALGRGGMGLIVGEKIDEVPPDPWPPLREWGAKGLLLREAAAGGAEVRATQQPVHDSKVAVPVDFGPGSFADSGQPQLCLVVPHFAMGGSDKYALDLARGLFRDHGWRVSFVSTLSKESDWEPDFRALGGDLFPLQKFLTRPDFPRFIASHLASRRADVCLIMHSALGYDCLPYLRALCPQTRFVDYLHILEPDWHDGGYPRYSVDFGTWLDRSFVSSGALADWLVVEGRAPENIEVVTTNIDPGNWNPDNFEAAEIREKWELPAGVRILLFAGRLHPQKQPLLLAEIVAGLESDSSLPPFLCLVAGDGPERERLESAGAGLERFRMLGQLDPADLQELMAVADVFLLPSANEGIALVLFEAMAMRCAVVATEAGGQAELVVPGTGVLIDPGGTGDLAKAFSREIAALLRDDRARAAMGSAARERIVNGYSLSRMGMRDGRGAPGPLRPLRLSHPTGRKHGTGAGSSRCRDRSLARGAGGIPDRPGRNALGGRDGGGIGATGKTES